MAETLALDLIQPDFLHVPFVGRPYAGTVRAGSFGLSLLRLEDDLVRAAVTAEMDDLGLLFVQLAQQVDRSGTGDQDQLHRARMRAQADFLVDFPELAWEIERGSSTWVRGEEEDRVEFAVRGAGS